MFVRSTSQSLKVCAETPATFPGMCAETPTLDICYERTQRPDLEFMKGNVHGALLNNLDSANSVKELTPTVDHYAVMCAFLGFVPTKTVLLVVEKRSVG